MIDKKQKQTSSILYSCYSHLSREGEHFIPEHVLSYIISGSQTVFLGGEVYQFNAGDLRFFRKNQLSKFVKRPSPGEEFKSISITMDQPTLQRFSTEYDIKMSGSYNGENILLLETDDLFKNYLNSLSPYMDSQVHNNDMLTTLKVKEAIMILLETNPSLKNTLFDFNDPGKIDLEAFMMENYKFNVDINRFAYLTGRSLATFKRDFERIFHLSPNRWIQKQRLRDAYFLIKEKGQKVSDVYMDVGFKDLSHFSFAFKKAYGIAPSQVI